MATHNAGAVLGSNRESHAIAARSGTWLRPSFLLACVFAAAALAQTLVYRAYLAGDPGSYNGAGAAGDQAEYLKLGQQLLHGGWIGASHYMPGLPAVLALCQAVFGNALFGIAVVQGLLFAGLVLGAWWLASSATESTAAGGWAAGLTALNPTLGWYASQALTEFLTGALVFLATVLLYRWTRRQRWLEAALCGLAIAATGYLRAEYLAFAVVFAAAVAIVGALRGRARHAARSAVVLLGATVLAMAPWVIRYTVVTGSPALYNESPVSNLVLMGTWFRIFDPATFAQLERIEKSSVPNQTAIEEAASVGPRPDLSVRYMEDVRGPYDRPLGLTLQMAVGNIRLDTRQWLVNHFLEAPVLIWIGHTPVRQSDASRVPTAARLALWLLQAVLLALALKEAVQAVRSRCAPALGLAFLGVGLSLTAVHILIAVDDRFTVPALPLIMLLAGVALARWRKRPRLAEVG